MFQQFQAFFLSPTSHEGFFFGVSGARGILGVRASSRAPERRVSRHVPAVLGKALWQQGDELERNLYP